ncbi:MAG: CapA family protein [Chloroflexi bacterium]|nr:CapA family protein [Chloroflexota bacterium]
MTDQGSKDTVVIHMVGDVGARRAEYGETPESIFAMTRQRIKEGDISFCHQEDTLSTRGCLQYRPRPTWYGRTHPDNVKSLVFAGFDVISHATNKCFNYGPEALLESIEVMRSNDIRVIGAGKDIVEARRPAIVEKHGIKVGFLAYCSVMDPEDEAREDKPGCNPVRVFTYYQVQDTTPGALPRVVTVPVEEDLRAMEGDIRKLRNQADIVVVSMHWGLHQPGVLAMYQPAVGHRAIDAGADIVVGHHSSLIKGIEVYKGKAIFYNLGHFAVDTPHHLKPPPGVYTRGPSTLYYQSRSQVEPGWERNPGPKERRYSMMVKCVAGKRAIRKVSFFPVYINRLADPEFLSQTDPRFNEVLGYADRWCKELGTNLTVEGDEVVVCSSTSR